MQKTKRLVPIPVLKTIQCLLIERNVQVGQIVPDGRRWGQELADHQRSTHPDRQDLGHPTNPSDARRDLPADPIGRHLVDQNGGMQLLGHALQTGR